MITTFIQFKKRRVFFPLGCICLNNLNDIILFGAIQVLRNAVGVGGVSFSEKKRYEGAKFNVISITRRWVGVKFPGKKHYVTLEWPIYMT